MDVDIARAQATAYVWGRQDAGESLRDTGYSIDFGEAYAEHVRQYNEGKIGMRMNIQSAFNNWRQFGEISLAITED